MCYIQFMNQREKLALDSWILNETVDSLQFLVTFQEKKFIWLSIVHGNKNKVAHFISSYKPLLKIEVLFEIISNPYCFGKAFLIFFLNGNS